MIKLPKFILFFFLIFCVPSHSITIVVFGDSLSAGYQLPRESGFIAQLQKVLESRGHDITLLDAAVPGDTTKGGLSRFDWAIPTTTDGVILELGANDALRGLPPQSTRSNLDSMIKKFKERDIEVLLTGMLSPPNLGDDYAHSFNTIYPELAKKHSILLYPFFLDGVAANPQFNLSDGIHPNEKGVEIIVESIVSYVEELIEKINK